MAHWGGGGGGVEHKEGLISFSLLRDSICKYVHSFFSIQRAQKNKHKSSNFRLSQNYANF